MSCQKANLKSHDWSLLFPIEGAYCESKTSLTCFLTLPSDTRASKVYATYGCVGSSLPFSLVLIIGVSIEY